MPKKRDPRLRVFPTLAAADAAVDSPGDAVYSVGAGQVTVFIVADSAQRARLDFLSHLRPTVQRLSPKPCVSEETKIAKQVARMTPEQRAAYLAALAPAGT